MCFALALYRLLDFTENSSSKKKKKKTFDRLDFDNKTKLLNVNFK